MADVKWIKITTDIFDDEKILLIESLPDCYAIITVWFKLLCLAGKQNNSGVFMMNNQIPYTEKMLATIFRMNEATVTLALQTFEQFGMVEIIDGVITIPNWNKHQTLDVYEKKKKRDRLYQAERRAAQRALIEKSPDKSSDNRSTNRLTIAVSEEDKERDKEKEEDKEGEEKEINKEKAQKIADMFNRLCPSLPQVIVLSKSIKNELSSTLQQFGEDKIIATFEKAEASSFLKGENPRKWAATFDWLIKAENIAKVLNGNFDDKGGYSFNMQAYKARTEQMPVYNSSKTVAEDEELKARAEALKQELSTG